MPNYVLVRKKIQPCKVALDITINQWSDNFQPKFGEVGMGSELVTPDRVDVLVQDWRRQLAVFDNPRDLVDLAEKIEFIRAAADKAKLNRNTINKMAAVLWDVVRKGGQASAVYEHRTGGDANSGLYDVSLNNFPTAKELGYHTAQQRQRWETCAAAPDIEVAHLKDKILGTSEGILTLAALLAAGKHFLRLQDAEETAAQSGDGCTVDDLQTLIDAGLKFKVIYADPPWTFHTYSGRGKSRSADRHYIVDRATGKSTMTIEELKAMPVPQLTDDNTALLLWSVWPEMTGALELIDAWGFNYKTAGFVWVKTSEAATFIDLEGSGLHWGMGYHTRANTEPCLLATRGSPQRLNNDVHQVIISPVGEHSRKPEQTSARIERLFGGPYIELFARSPRQGWTVWGNDITRGLFHQSIPQLDSVKVMVAATERKGDEQDGA